MPSAAVTYPKLLQTSAETKRKTKFFVFGYAEFRRNLSKVTTNECRNAVVTNGGRGVVMMVAVGDRLASYLRVLEPSDSE